MSLDVSASLAFERCDQGATPQSIRVMAEIAYDDDEG
jgi:hypothetical protein